MQMFADTLGLPVVAGPAESTALGNALVQLLGCGLVSSQAQMRHISRRSISTVTYNPEK